MQIVAESGLGDAVSWLPESAPAAFIRSAANDTALRWAASKGRTEAIRVLAAAGARLNEAGRGSLPLNNAVKRRHDDTAAFLVEAGARFAVSLDGHTAASIALDLGLPQTLTAIAAKGGIAPLRDRLSIRLANAVVRDSPELVAALLPLGADARSRTNDIPLLAFAAQRPGAAPIIGALLGARADPAEADSAGVAPLAVAVRSGDLANTRALLAAGASTTQADRHRRVALHYAAAGTDPAIVPLLVAAGAPLATLDEGDSSPLAIALARQSNPMIAAFVDCGARIDLRSAEAPHLLVQAVLLDQVELLRRTADDGWDSGEIAGNPWSPVALARMAGAHRVTAWLEHRGPSGGVIPRLDARDSPPRPVHTPQPVDPRVEDALFSESTVAITAIVEADGSLSHVIARSPHDRLRTATLAAVRMWRLTPATRAGVPKPIPITFPVQFPVRDNRLFSLSDVEREPVLARSGSAAALNLRGMVKEDLLEDFAGALADFDRAIELAPQEHRFFYTNRARVRLAQFRDFEGAVADMNQAFDLGPGDAADYYIRGLAYYRLRKREEAFADMDRSLTLRPPERAAYYYRGLIHRQRKEVSAAVADFTQARFRAPSQLARQFPHAIPAAREEPQLRTRAGRSGAAIDPRAERPLGHRH